MPKVFFSDSDTILGKCLITYHEVQYEKNLHNLYFTQKSDIKRKQIHTLILDFLV